jgi:hypothetical protein
MATVASLGDTAVRQHQFVDRRVLLTGEREILATENGRRCFADCLRLLIRMVRHLTVDVESADGQLAEEMTALARDLAWDSIPTIGRSPMTPFFPSVRREGATCPGLL